MARISALIFILLLFSVLGLAFSDGGAQFIRHAASSLALLLAGPPIPASSGALSEHDREELDLISPQDQATRLLEKAINHYKGAGEEFAKRLDSWTGKIHSTPELENLSNTAYFSSDLRIRMLALELWLVRDNIRKSPQTVDELIRDAGIPDDRQYFRLSTLGILGNRGIEPGKIFSTLVQFIHAPSGETRSAAINGLGLLGTESTIEPLLDVLRWDTSHDLRERAACNLADSGMLSRELRQKAVPGLIQFAQDETLDATTKKWVFQALREITQQSLPDDAAAWTRWRVSR